MTTLDPDDRYHIEARLRRELTAEQLEEAESIDEAAAALDRVLERVRLP